jgi:hypothetical protein
VKKLTVQIKITQRSEKLSRDLHQNKYFNVTLLTCFFIVIACVAFSHIDFINVSNKKLVVIQMPVVIWSYRTFIEGEWSPSERFPDCVNPRGLVAYLTDGAEYPRRELFEKIKLISSLPYDVNTDGDSYYSERGLALGMLGFLLRVTDEIVQIQCR